MHRKIRHCQKCGGQITKRLDDVNHGLCTECATRPKPSSAYTKFRQMFPEIKDWQLGGGFGSALYEGDLKEAFARADFEGLKRLQQVVGKTKAEYMVDIGYWHPSARGERYRNPETGELI
jgi:hypothetical protein